MPASFMTGSMLVVAIISIITGQMYMPRSIKVIAQIISGAYLGQQVSKQDVLQLPRLTKPIVSLLLFFTLNMFVMGKIFSLFFHMDAITALLSCLPGGIMDVSLISIDMGAQSEIVATMQFIRLVGMLLILPYWIQLILARFNKQSKNPEESTEKETLKKQLPFGIMNQTKNNLLILLISSIGGILGVLSEIPVGALIFSLIFSIVLKLAKNTAPLSANIRYFEQILAGSIIGCSFTLHNMLQMGQLIFPAITLLFSYLVINFIFAFSAYRLGFLDLQSALFASSPAGATDIALIEGDFGGDMPKIAAVQICRMLYSVIVMPFLVHFFVS